MGNRYREDARRRVKLLDVADKNCANVMFYPQVSTNTCWFCAVMNALFFSDGARHVLMHKAQGSGAPIYTCPSFDRENLWASPINPSSKPRRRASADAMYTLFLGFRDLLRKHKFRGGAGGAWTEEVINPHAFVQAAHDMLPNVFKKPRKRECYVYFEARPLLFLLSLMGVNEEDMRVYTANGSRLFVSDGKLTSRFLPPEVLSVTDVVNRVCSGGETDPAKLRIEAEGNKFQLCSILASTSVTECDGIGHTKAIVTCKGRLWFVDSSTSHLACRQEKHENAPSAAHKATRASMWSESPNPEPLEKSAWNSRMYPCKSSLYVFYNTKYSSSSSSPSSRQSRADTARLDAFIRDASKQKKTMAVSLRLPP